MSNYKKVIPCIFIQQGKAVQWFDNNEIIAQDVVALAKQYSDMGADELIVFDLSDNDKEHDDAIDLMKKINRVIPIQMIAGGNIKRQEDVKKILYTGAKKAFLNFAKETGIELIEEVSKRFGKEKIAVSISDIETLTKHQELIETYASEIIFVNCKEIESVKVLTKLPTTIVSEQVDESKLFAILKKDGINGLSGMYVSEQNFNFKLFKEACEKQCINMSILESKLDFASFKLNEEGLIPVIVQHYKTDKVLMLAYMDQDAFEQTIKTGKMTYYSRSRKERWVKGETSGHYQFVKSLTLDCDNDTILAKVEQIGVACHTGAPTCFFQPLVEDQYDELNPLQVFQSVYDTIADRKVNPKEGSYTNYLFDKGIDKILKKVGEEATELVIAAKNPNPEEIKYELSDFLYHAMVLMVERGVTWEDIVKELADR